MQIGVYVSIYVYTLKTYIFCRECMYMYTRGRVDHAGAKSLIYICFYDNRIMSNIDPHLCIIYIYFAAVFRHRIYPEICAYLVLYPHSPHVGIMRPHAREYSNKKRDRTAFAMRPRKRIFAELFRVYQFIV